MTSVMFIRCPGPARGPLRRDAGGLTACGIFEALVQDHHDVAPESELHVDCRFGSEQMCVAVKVRTEDDARFGDLAERAQAEDLEAAGIGENGPWPTHEFVQPTEGADGLVAGAQV